MLELLAIFARGQHESFEAGMESIFSRELVAFIEANPVKGMRYLQRLIRLSTPNPALAAEALRWLGHMGQGGKSYAQRLALLRGCLTHKSARVRDAAALGLSYLDDPSAIPSLHAAVEREKIPELREDLRQVLRQLEDEPRG